MKKINLAKTPNRLVQADKHEIMDQSTQRLYQINSGRDTLIHLASDSKRGLASTLQENGERKDKMPKDFKNAFFNDNPFTLNPSPK